MIGFVVPFRSKDSSSNWNLHVNLLYRTVKSICNQTDLRFFAFVVYTDMPERKVEHENVTYIRYPFPYLKAEEILDYESYGKLYYTPNDAQNAMDQGRKILYGCAQAKLQGCDYIMSVDADDLVSSRISEYVNKSLSSKAPGWYISKGYVLLEDKKLLYRQPGKMNEINGSTHIIYKDLIPSPDFASRKLMDFNFFSAHGWLRYRLLQYENINLFPLPFYAVLYSMNSGSWMYGRQKFENTGIRKIIKYVVRGCFSKRKIVHEFGYYRIEDSCK